MRYWSIGLLMLWAVSTPGQSLKFRQVTVDLQRDDRRSAFLLGGVYFADLVGGPEPELIVINGFASFEVWSLNQQGRRPSYAHLASLPLSEQDETPMPQLFTFASLNKTGKLSLIVADHAGIWHYPAAGGRLATERELLLAQPLLGSRLLGMSYLDFALDIDGDGLDELLIPDIDRPLLWKKNATGWSRIALPGLEEKTYSSFAVMGFEMANDAETFPPGIAQFSNSSRTPAFYFHDYNGDGQLDLYRFKREPIPASSSRGSFGDEAGETIQLERVEIDIRLFSEGRFATTATMRLIGRAPVEDNSFFSDLNGDGLLDRVEAWANYDPVAPIAITRFFLAQGAPTFKLAEQPDFSFRSRSPFGDNYLADVNADGVIDLFLLEVNYLATDMNDIAQIALGGKLRLTLQGYLSRNGAWPEKPDVRKALELNDFRDRGMSNILTLDHDFTGDGLPDLAFASRAGRLDIYAYDQNALSFSRRKTGSCKDLGMVWTCADLNADGRADIISYDPDSERLIIQLSRQ